MDRKKYIGFGITGIIVLTIILCIFLIPSANESRRLAESVQNPVATTFPPEITTPFPIQDPVCTPESQSLLLKDVRVNLTSLVDALSSSCAGLLSLKLRNVELMGLRNDYLVQSNENRDPELPLTDPIPRVTLPNLKHFTFDRALFPRSGFYASRRKQYLEGLTETNFQDDFVFLNKKDGSREWKLGDLSSSLNLESLEVRINGLEILKLDRTNGIVRFRQIRKIENEILSSVRNDPQFQLRNLTSYLGRLDVDNILPKAGDLTGLYLYYSSLFSQTDPSQNLHSLIRRCTHLTELHLHLYDDPFNTLDTSDLESLNDLTSFSFHYGGSVHINQIRLTHNDSSVSLPKITYLYINTDWGKLDPRFITAIPTLLPNLNTLIYGSYVASSHDYVLHELLKMPSLISVSFYSYHLFDVPPAEQSDHAAEIQAFLKRAKVPPGIHDFIITRQNSRGKWEGRELRYFEKEGFSRLAED